MLKSTIEYWNTPYAMVEGDVASAGIPVWIRQPLGTGVFSIHSTLLSETDPTLIQGHFDNDALGAPVLIDENGDAKEGRVAALIDYWAGGAPGHHGASVNGKIAYHWKCVLRPVAGRSWWSSTAVPSFRVAYGGNGFFCITKTISGVTTFLTRNSVAIREDVEEGAILESGLLYSDLITTMAAGDSLDIYYVQDEAFAWGGYVFKAALDTSSSSPYGNLQLGRDAPVICYDLFDNGTQPTKQTLESYGKINIRRQQNHTSTASVNIPLANIQYFDAKGWEFVKQTDDDPGYLRLYKGSLTDTIDVHRARMIRIHTGFTDEYDNDEMYTTFTGLIDDFGDISGGTLPMQCTGFEQRLLDQHIKNYPDRISYMAANYIKRKGTAEPVYDVTAYDNWPLELVFRDLFVRAGLGESVTRQRLTVPLSDGTTSEVQYNSELFDKFRARSLGGNRIRLERPVHYGNTGKAFNPRKAADDKYIFVPENTKEIWNTCRDITERYGYAIWFDEFGHCILRAINNPSAIDNLESATDATLKTHPNAYAGTYLEWTTAAPTLTKTYTAARIDVILPRLVSAGSWNFTVKHNGITVSSGTLNPAVPSGSMDEFFYDYRTTIDGANTTVVTLYSGDYQEYEVTLTGTGGAATRRLDGFLLWHTDPLLPRFTHLFSTSINALSVEAKGAMDETRNYVLLVGRRKATVTDSGKFDENPNNPIHEFVVKAGVDIESILDYQSPHFLGYQKESIIYDEKITDDDHAGYLANAFIFKYRLPKPSAGIQHTLIPILQLFEPLYAVEQTFQSITADSVLWVTGFSHDIEYDQATTTIETTSYVPLPAYEPREDIDIDAHFGGNPVINVEVSYQSLANNLNTNLALGAVEECDEKTDIVSAVKTVTAGSPPYLDMSANAWPPIPDTVFISPAVGNTAAATLETTEVTPIYYAHYGLRSWTGIVEFNGSITTPALQGLQSVFSVVLQVKTSSFPGASTTEITLTTTRPTVIGFDAVGKWYYEVNTVNKTVTAYRINGTPPTNNRTNDIAFKLIVKWYKNVADSSERQFLTNTPYHHFMNVDYRDSNKRIYLPWKQGDDSSLYTRSTNLTSYLVRYRKLWPGNNSSDPYSGTSPFYDPYSSELGYVCDIRWDQLVSGLVRVTVRNVVDDTVVAYLTEPAADSDDEELHWTYFTAGTNRNLQWDGVDNVGVWNQRQSRLWATYAQGAFEKSEPPIIGKGFYVWNLEERSDGTLGPLALISGERDTNTGAPVFGHGTYASWYIKFEVQNDTLGEIPRLVDTNALDAAFNGGDEAAIIYTHLPEAVSAVELSEVADFSSSVAYDEDNPPTSDAGFWQVIPSGDSIIHNKKPIRVRYAILPRPGPLWVGNYNKAGVRLHEHVHLRATIFDQLIVKDGVNYPGTSVPKQTVVNRKITNDSHSVVFEDADYVTGDTFKTTTGGEGREWVFLPKDFERDFGEGFEEPIEFMNYLQLEELPYWDENRQIAGKSSRMQIAFMNYLFYLSVHTSDRSGRMQWAMNRKMLDRAKIIKNAYADWWKPDAPGTPATQSTYRAEVPRSPYQHRRTVLVRQWQDEGTWKSDQITKYSLSGTVGEQLLRHKWAYHDRTYSNINSTNWSSFGLERDDYSHWHTDAGRSSLPSSFNALERQLGDSASTKLGTWTWETSPSWVPCITRDFHPYYLLPPMPDLPLSQLLSQFDITFLHFTNNNTTNSYEEEYEDTQIYLISDVKDYDEDENTGRDAAAGEVWNSVVWDMTETYSSSGNGRVRFWPGTVVDPKAGPAKERLAPDGDDAQDTNVLDYIRQDEMVHFEDLRGTYSRGPRPAEGPKKVNPTSPYYSNAYAYIAGITVEENDHSPGYPKYRTRRYPLHTNGGWFEMRFRNEYFWESGTLFPTDTKGVEFLEAFNYTKTRMMSPAKLALTRFDDGAWTGWKDDFEVLLLTDPEHKLKCANLAGEQLNVFRTGYLPFAVGPKIISGTGALVTTDMIFSMVLVNERREGEV